MNAERKTNVIPFPSERLKETLQLSLKFETLKNAIRNARSLDELVSACQDYTLGDMDAFGPHSVDELMTLYLERHAQLNMPKKGVLFRGIRP